MVKKHTLIPMLAMGMLLFTAIAMAEINIDSSDQEIADQLDQQAKAFIISGDFVSALEKLQAAEVMSPDAGRAQRIQRLNSFVDIRKGIKPSVTPDQALSQATEKAPVSPSPAVTPGNNQASIPPVAAKKLIPAASEEERRVRAVIDTLLQFLHANIDDAAELIMGPDYQLTQVEQSFHAEFETIILRSDNNNHLDMGKLKLILSPEANHQMNFVVKLNNAFKIVEKGKEIADFSMDSYDIHGIWNEKLEIFEDFSAKIQKPILSVKGNEPGIIRADQFVLLQNLKRTNSSAQAADNQWQQNMESILTNLYFEISDKQGKQQLLFKLDDFNLKASVSGSNFERLAELRKQMQENLLVIAAEENSQNAKKMMKKVQLQGIELFNLLDISDTSATLKGLSFASPDGNMSLKEIGFGLMAGSQAHNKGELKIHLISSELKTSGAAEIPPGMLPNNIEFNLSIENFPSGVVNLISEISDNPGKKEEISRRFIESMQQSKTNMLINKVAIDFDDYALDMAANALVNIKSPFFTTGEANMSIVNFPMIIDKVKQFGAPAEINMMLSAMSLVSIRSEENGKVTDQFDFIWAEDGKLLLNGKDAMMLLGAPAK